MWQELGKSLLNIVLFRWGEDGRDQNRCNVTILLLEHTPVQTEISVSENKDSEDQLLEARQLALPTITGFGVPMFTIKNQSDQAIAVKKECSLLTCLIKKSP